MNLKLFAATALVASCIPVAAKAAVITWDFASKYNGATPSSTPPWLRVTLTDGSANQVVVMFTSLLGSSSTQFLEEVDFNLASIPSPLTSSSPTSTGSFSVPTFSASSNAYGASTGGNFDLRFVFDGTGNNGNKRFSDTDTYQLTLTGTGLSTSSFNTVSSGGTTGPYYAAANVEVSNGSQSWVTVPEPATLGAVAAAGILALRRRRRT